MLFETREVVPVSRPPPPPQRTRRRDVGIYAARWLPYCDGPSLQACSGVNREWREAASATVLWETLLTGANHTNGAHNELHLSSLRSTCNFSLAEIKRVVLRRHLIAVNTTPAFESPAGCKLRQTFKESMDRASSQPHGGASVAASNASTVPRKYQRGMASSHKTFSGPLHISFPRMAQSGSHNSPQSMDAARKNFLARAWYSYPIANDLEILKQRADILGRNFPEVQDLVHQEKTCLSLQQELIVALESRAPSDAMLCLHRRAVKWLARVQLFECIAVECLVGEALRMLRSPTDLQKLPKSASDIAEDSACAEVLRLKLCSTQRFVDLEMFLVAHGQFETYGLARLWVQTKTRLPVNHQYYDLVDLLYAWGPQWSPRLKLQEPAVWSEARRSKAEAQISGSYQTLLDKINKVIRRRQSAGKNLPFVDFMSAVG